MTLDPSRTLAASPMQLLIAPDSHEHDTGMHPENKKRLEGLQELSSVCSIDGMPYLDLVHSKDYIQSVRVASEGGKRLDADTVTSPGSFQAACYAVGATIEAAEKQDFALVRPPGHHAFPSRGSGFCLFNNVGITAQKLVSEGKRVLIFDFDGHLGDGTMDLFYENDQVLFWSIHQYPAYPGNGFSDEIGRGKGRGYTMNVPLPAGSGDDIFMHAIDTFLPIAIQFKPDVVALSAGFDAHQYDHLLQLKATVNTYYKIGQIFRTTFPHVFATLEGGYNPEILSQCLFSFIAGFNGLGMPYKEPATSSGLRIWEEYDINIHIAMANLCRMWKF